MEEYNNNNGQQQRAVNVEYKAHLKTLMHGFGMKLKKRDVDECDVIFNKIFGSILPSVSNGLIKYNDWFLNASTLSRIPDGQIVVVAHHKRVSRFMAIISTLPVDIHHEAMPVEYCRVLHRIQIREPTSARRPRIYLKPQGMVKLLSTRRGIYALNREFYEMHIIAKKIGPKEYKVDTNTENMLYNYYKEKIHGIEQRPKIVKQLPSHKGIEQFLIDLYPNKKWKDGYEQMLKTKQVAGSSSSSSSDEEDEGSESEMSETIKKEDKPNERKKHLRHKKSGSGAIPETHEVEERQIENAIVCPNCNSWVNMRILNDRICVDTSMSDHLIGKNVTSIDPHLGLKMLYFDGLSTGGSNGYGDDPVGLIRDAYI